MHFPISHLIIGTWSCSCIFCSHLSTLTFIHVHGTPSKFSLIVFTWMNNWVIETRAEVSHHVAWSVLVSQFGERLHPLFDQDPHPRQFIGNHSGSFTSHYSNPLEASWCLRNVTSNHTGIQWDPPPHLISSRRTSPRSQTHECHVHIFLLTENLQNQEAQPVATIVIVYPF